MDSTCRTCLNPSGFRHATPNALLFRPSPAHPVWWCNLAIPGRRRRIHEAVLPQDGNDPLHKKQSVKASAGILLFKFTMSLTHPKTWLRHYLYGALALTLLCASSWTFASTYHAKPNLPKRIVSLAPGITEILFRLDLETTSSGNGFF